MGEFGKEFARYLERENEQLLRSFAEQPNERKLRNLANRLKLKTHQACLVLRCTFDNTAFLFGGDADKSVWNRLIRQKRDISAKYFKIPHHGSKYNLSRRILKYVNPKIAIISHDNARFGRSKDTHPNQEVLNWIAALNIGLVSTNDIRKRNALVWDRDRQNMCDANIEVVDV